MSDRDRQREQPGGSAPASATRSVDRACEIMAAFTLERPRLSLSELAQEVGLAKATVHRLAGALAARGMLVQGPDTRYALGAKVMELGAIVRERLDAVQLCRQAIDLLSAQTDETVLLASADWPAQEILVVLRRDSPHPLAVGSPVGRRMPIPPGGALGKALLAGLPDELEAAILRELRLEPSTARTIVDRDALLGELRRARRRGYASEQGEFIDGVSGVAVPVLFDGAHPQAAVGIVGPTSRLAGKVDALGRLLRDATVTLRPSGRSAV